MNIKAVITTTKIINVSNDTCSCQLHVNGKWKGDLYGDSVEELTSLCDHIKTKTNAKHNNT